MLTGLELTFMGLIRSSSSLFSTPGFIVAPVGKKERGGRKKKRKRREGGEKGIGRKGRKEEGIKKDQRQDKKEF